MPNDLRLTFTPERETKRTWRFSENVPSDDEPMVGTIYVRKATLKQLGWQKGDSIILSISLPA